MGHYAKINNENKVESVIVATIDYINSRPDSASFIKTSYNTLGGIHYVPNSNYTIPSEDQSKSLRKNYATIEGIYDPDLDTFYCEQPYASWTLNTETCTWEPPLPHPGGDEGDYEWDESSQSWVGDINPE